MTGGDDARQARPAAVASSTESRLTVATAGGSRPSSAHAARTPASRPWAKLSHAGVVRSGVPDPAVPRRGEVADLEQADLLVERREAVRLPFLAVATATTVPAARIAVTSSGVSASKVITAAGVNDRHRSMMERAVRDSSWVTTVSRCSASALERCSMTCPSLVTIGQSGSTTRTRSLRPSRSARAAADGA